MTKLALAERQLETAIGLFVSGRDRLSAITLAGAADGILHGLVLKAGDQPFSDYAMGVREALSKETPAKRLIRRKQIWTAITTLADSLVAHKKLDGDWLSSHHGNILGLFYA